MNLKCITTLNKQKVKELASLPLSTSATGQTLLLGVSENHKSITFHNHRALLRKFAATDAELSY